MIGLDLPIQRYSTTRVSLTREPLLQWNRTGRHFSLKSAFSCTNALRRAFVPIFARERLPAIVVAPNGSSSDDCKRWIAVLRFCRLLSFSLAFWFSEMTSAFFFLSAMLREAWHAYL
jgi:hypothetical protein